MPASTHQYQHLLVRGMALKQREQHLHCPGTHEHRVEVVGVGQVLQNGETLRCDLGVDTRDR